MRILIAGLTALMVSVGFYGAMWLAMDWPDQAERKLTKVPLIKAEVGPVKQKPLNSGGLPIPNLDMLVFGLLERDHSPDCPGGAITRNFWINQAVEADPDMTKFVTCSG